MDSNTRKWTREEEDLLHRVLVERMQQEKRFGSERKQIDTKGSKHYYNLNKIAVLGEEVGEVIKAYLDHEPNSRVIDELVQVMAVCLAWATVFAEEHDESL